MISATEALNLPKAKFTNEDIELTHDVLNQIDQHIHKKMTFAGVEPLELQPHQMSFAASKIVCVMLKRLGWNMSASFGVKQSELGGRTTIWQLSFSPAIEIYETLLADFEIEPKPQLM